VIISADRWNAEFRTWHWSRKQNQEQKELQKLTNKNAAFFTSTAVAIVTQFLLGKAEVREFKTRKILRIPRVSVQPLQTRTFSRTWRTDSLHCTVSHSKWPFALTPDTRKLKIYLNNIYTSSWHFKKTSRLNYKTVGCCSLGKNRCILWQSQVTHKCTGWGICRCV